MEPKIWGPPAWIFLHSVTLNYPNNPTPQDKEDYRIFLDSLQHILPCPTCKEHYAKNIRSNPINLRDRTSLINWLIDIHNQVNIYNSKPKLSYQEVYDIYDKLYNLSDSNKKKLYKEYSSVMDEFGSNMSFGDQVSSFKNFDKANNFII